MDSRVLDVGATDPRLAQRLAEENRYRYLGLVEPSQLADVCRQADTLASRFHPLTSMSQVLGNSTDLLILRKPFIPHLWSIGRLRHVSYLAVEVGPRAQDGRGARRPPHRPAGGQTFGAGQVLLRE